ncbi:MAG: NAD(P)-dependent oxidoreductase [Clostridia bacterium]|nr:NAD(P)-dependent oxidoreductase [Clostridia bacterium]
MSNITVTGGGGYIGSLLVPLLLSKGHCVTVIDSFMFSQSSLLDCCADKKLTVIRGDVRDGECIKRAIDGAEFIIPLAAIVGFPLCDFDKTAAQTVNYDSIELLLSLRDREQKIIFPCSNSGYGTTDGETYCTEDSVMEPISLYGRTKVAAEKAILTSGNSLSFRFATLFGASPRMRTDLLVNDFVKRAVNDGVISVFEGNFKRNFLHVRDAANAFLFAVENFDRMKGSPYNCGLSDANLSKLQLCEKIKEHIPSLRYSEVQFASDPDKRDYIISNERIESMGFCPVFSLDDGIEELIKVYRILRTQNYSNI